MTTSPHKCKRGECIHQQTVVDGRYAYTKAVHDIKSHGDHLRGSVRMGSYTLGQWVPVLQASNTLGTWWVVREVV